MKKEKSPFDSLKLKDSLIFSIREENDEYQYILEDQFSEKFYRIGAREYEFIIQLDGKQSLGLALHNVNQANTKDALSEEQATEIISWLMKEELVESESEEENISISKANEQTVFEKVIQKANIIFFRIPLLNPNSFLDKLAPKLSWLTSKSFILIWLALIFTGIFHVISQWPRFEQASLGVFYPLNWLWLILGYILLKTSHEIFHGLVSKSYGGAVHEAGVILVLFIPIGYVNATSSWHFPSKWQRFHTAVAGMFIELLFAAVACWVWAYTENGPLNNFAYNMIVIASISTLLFNANPLMRFDGYFALSDVVNQPNLYARGRHYVQYLFRRYILGQEIVFPSGRNKQINIVKIYGVASFIWRIFVITIILIAAYSLFYGAGIVLAGIALLAYITPPMIRTLKKLSKVENNEVNYLNGFIRVGSIFVVSIVMFTQFSWSRDIIAPGIVDYQLNGVIKSSVEGFVKNIHVAPGDRVEKGQLLLELENKTLMTELKVLESQLHHAETSARIFLNHDQHAQYKIQNENITAYKKRLELKREQVNQLTLYAPISGLVVSGQLSELQDQFISVGNRLMQIGDEKSKKLYLSVLQKDQYDTDQLFNQAVKVRVANKGVRNINVHIKQETPRANKNISFPQLSAINGGPIAVVPTSQVEDSAEVSGQYEYIDPRAEIQADISPSDAIDVYAGQLAWARLPSLKRTLGEHIYIKIESWVRYLFDRERW